MHLKNILSITVCNYMNRYKPILIDVFKFLTNMFVVVLDRKTSFLLIPTLFETPFLPAYFLYTFSLVFCISLKSRIALIYSDDEFK